MKTRRIWLILIGTVAIATLLLIGWPTARAAPGVVLGRDTGLAGSVGLSPVLVRDLRDQWGRPLNYLLVDAPAAPDGAILWDLEDQAFFVYSVGPNGLDEQGSGDDIVVSQERKFLWFD